MRIGTVIVVTSILTLLLLSAPIACTNTKEVATHDHGDHDHTAMSAAGSYSDAIRQIQTHMAAIDTTIKSEKYTGVHKDAEAIIELTKTLGSAAAAANSPVPKSKVQEVTESAKELADATDSMHDAAHSGEVQQVKEHYAQMIKLVDALAMYLPKP
jgi:hypothetical protein